MSAPWQRTVCTATLMLMSHVVNGACALEAEGQGRWYPSDQDVGQRYATLASLGAIGKCDYRSERDAFSAEVFARVAQHDSARTHADVHQLLWTHTLEPVQLRAGINTVSWGVMEFAHLVDAVNQADVLEDPFGDVKLGQPMINVEIRRTWGSLSGYAMPLFRRRVFPRLGEPMRAAPPVAIGSPLFESNRGRDHWDWALRYALHQGALDLGISYFDGTAHDPSFVDPRMSASGPTVTPFYALIQQTSVDMQLTFGEWSFKLEGAHREQSGPDNNAYAIGVEYAIGSFAGSPADLTFAAEYVRDHRLPPTPPGFVDNDWAVGVRLALNDVRSTEGKFGVIVDRQHGSRAWALELGSRLADRWRLATKARWFDRVSGSDPLRVIRADGYLDLSLTRYF